MALKRGFILIALALALGACSLTQPGPQISPVDAAATAEIVMTESPNLRIQVEAEKTLVAATQVAEIYQDATSWACGRVRERVENGDFSDFSPGAYLAHCDLSDLDLVGLDLRGANLSGADLQAADLSETSLAGADLSGANLQDAVVTAEQLAAAASLAGATLPDGTTQP